jgi:hypothetical protein
MPPMLHPATREDGEKGTGDGGASHFGNMNWTWSRSCQVAWLSGRTTL